jgi:hypothetical protein
MTITLRDPVQAGSTTLTPNPWGVPQPDGPLAAALRDAQAQRAQGAAMGPQEAPSDIPIEVLPDLAPVEVPAAPSADGLALEIEKLAREARAQDPMREALALALEWPDEAPAGRQTRPWRGWAALAGMVVLAGAAAAVAVSMSSNDVPVPPIPLKLEKSLSLPAR